MAGTARGSHVSSSGSGTESTQFLSRKDAAFRGRHGPTFFQGLATIPLGAHRNGGQFLANPGLFSGRHAPTFFQIRTTIPFGSWCKTRVFLVGVMRHFFSSRDWPIFLLVVQNSGLFSGRHAPTFFQIRATIPFGSWCTPERWPVPGKLGSF